MTEPDPPTPKWPLLAGFLIAIVDIVFLYAVGRLSDQPFTLWLTGFGIQFLVGITLIATGGDGKPWGKALIYGLVYLLVLIASLGLLALVVCVGLFTSG